jgi:hypothetical protein
MGDPVQRFFLLLAKSIRDAMLRLVALVMAIMLAVGALIYWLW